MKKQPHLLDFSWPKPKPIQWILHARIFSPQHKKGFFEGHIKINKKGAIEKITQTLPSQKKLRSTHVLNAKRLFIFPGLIQTHIHLCQSLFINLAERLPLLPWLRKRIWPLESTHTPRSLYLSTFWGACELLRSGTTSVLDMSTTHHTEVIFQALEKIGMRATVGFCFMDHLRTTAPTLYVPMKKALYQFDKLFEHYRPQYDPRLEIAYAPRFSLSCTEKLLKTIAKRASKQNTLIHTHSNETQAENTLIRKRTGKDPFVYLHQLGLTQKNQLVIAHGVVLTLREKKLLSQTKTAVIHCPSSNLKLGSGWCSIQNLWDHNIKVGIGIDGAPCNNRFSLFEEMKLATLIPTLSRGLQKRPSALSVLKMATEVGAHILKKASLLGTLEVGKKADLFAIWIPHSPSAIKSPEDLTSSLIFSANAQDVAWTLVDGRLCWKKNLRYEKALFKLQESMLYFQKRAIEKGKKTLLQ